jgi:hypothetical protein
MIYFLLSLFLILSLVINGVLVWYTRNVVRQLNYAIDNFDDFQKFLDEYCETFEEVYKLTDFYGDETIKQLINNTKKVSEASKNFKKSVLGQEIENETDTKQAE